MERTHLEAFMNDHPELKPLEECQYVQVLEWAHSKKYIVLKEFATKRFYSEAQLDTAIMWAEKEGVLPR